jgi:hypothetical protein
LPAAATLRFHSTRREASLVDLDDTVPRAQGDLCAQHTDTLLLPRGWALHDERTPAVAILRPVADVRETELADVLDARTPLLQRAFRNALPQ